MLRHSIMDTSYYDLDEGFPHAMVPRPRVPDIGTHEPV